MNRALTKITNNTCTSWLYSVTLTLDSTDHSLIKEHGKFNQLLLKKTFRIVTEENVGYIHIIPSILNCKKQIYNYESYNPFNNDGL